MSLPTSRNSASLSSSAPSASSGPDRSSTSSLFTRDVTRKGLFQFTRSFAVMVNARLPLVDALRSARKQSEDEALRDVLDAVIRDVEGGRSLSESLEQHPDVFSSLYVNLVRVGEAAGILGDVLLQLADYLERQNALRRKVRLAFVYPGLILTIAVGATVFLLTVIVPTFADLFADFGAELPAPTQVVLDVSRLLTDYALVLVGGLVAAGLLVRALLRTDTGQRWKDTLVLHLPLFGSLVRKSLTARFCRTVGTLLGNGVGLVDALSIQQKAAGNVRIQDAIQDMVQAVERGDTLTASAATSTYFPEMVVQMIRVGEETAELDEMLLRAADHHESEVEDVAETLTSVLEPILIVIIGILLGSILVSMYLPMFDMMNVVQ